MTELWKIKFEAEIQRAESARSAGNEGMARVCARRAAGLALAEYYTRRRLPFNGPSAYDHLRTLAGLPDVPEQVRAVADHFLVRITPEHSLPVEADLIAEARWLAETLLDHSDVITNQGDSMESAYTFFPDLVEEMASVPTDSIVSRTIYKDERLSVVLFGFAPGQELSEHTASVPATIQILQGECSLTLGPDQMAASTGSWARMPANLPHSLLAKTPVVMLLTMLKQAKSES
jgi:quercetin dioxygenase-like cupin family protein